MSERINPIEQLLFVAGEEHRASVLPSPDFSSRVKAMLREEGRSPAKRSPRIIEVSRVRRAWAVAAGTIAIMAVAGIVFQWFNRERVELVYSAGAVEGAQKFLREGDTLITGGDGRSIGRLDDGRVWVLVAENSMLEVVGEDRLHLDEGDLWVEVETASGFFEVTTPHARVTVMGTRFGVSHDEAGTRVVLESGKISLEAGGTTEELKPGESASISTRGSKPVVAEKISVEPGWIEELLKEFMASAAARKYPSGWSSRK